MRRLFGCLLTSVCLLLSAGAAWPQGRDTVYRSVGPDGKVTYSQTPPADGSSAQRRMEFDRLPASPLPPEVAKFREDMERRAAQRQAAAGAADVTGLRLFSAVWCGYCRQAKAWLAAQGVAYQELDIDTPGGMQAFAQASGKGGIPLLTGPGVRVQGFTAAAYAQALKRP